MSGTPYVKQYTVQFTKDVLANDYRGGSKTVTHWPIIGRAFEKADGRIDVKIDSMPIAFDGRLFLFPIKE